MPNVIFAAVITQQNLNRLKWIFADTRPRRAYAGRTEGRHLNAETEEVMPHSFGRQSRRIFTTNGFFYSLEISCAFSNPAQKESLVYLSVRKGTKFGQWHFVAAPYKGTDPAVEFRMERKTHCIHLRFGQKFFKIPKKDISTGSGRNADSPVSILWGEADAYRYDLCIDWDAEQAKLVENNPRATFLESRLAEMATTEDEEFA